MRRDNSPARRKACRITIAVCCFTLNFFAFDFARAGDILLAGHYAGAGGVYPTAVFRFDHQGSFESTIGDGLGRSYGTAATYGGEIFVGSTEVPDGQEIRRYSKQGDFLGFFGPPNLSLTGAWKMEFDSSGNLYAVDFSDSKSVRLDSNGLVTGLFPSGSSIDADSNGNVYVSLDRKLGKYDLSGNLIATLNTPERRGPGDMAIDEINSLLYLSDENDSLFGVKQYDISGTMPVLLAKIPTPGGVCGLSFDETTGHLLAAQVGIGTPPRALELQIDGTIVREYSLGGSAFVFDVAAIQIPEPTSLVLFLWAVTSLGLLRPWQRQSH